MREEACVIASYFYFMVIQTSKDNLRIGCLHTVKNKYSIVEPLFIWSLLHSFSHLQLLCSTIHTIAQGRGILNFSHTLYIHSVSSPLVSFFWICSFHYSQLLMPLLKLLPHTPSSTLSLPQSYFNPSYILLLEWSF